MRGTAFAVTRRVAITCRHVCIATPGTPQPGELDRLREHARETLVLVDEDGGELRPSDVRLWPGIDAAALLFDQDIVAAAPLIVRGVTAAHLRGMAPHKLRVWGYPEDAGGGVMKVGAFSEDALTPYTEGGESGSLESFQITGGVPRGMSGGPVVFHGHPESPVMGMVQQGGRGAVVSMVATMERMLHLLAESGIQPDRTRHWHELCGQTGLTAYLRTGMRLWDTVVTLGDWQAIGGSTLGWKLSDVYVPVPTRILARDDQMEVMAEPASVSPDRPDSLVTARVDGGLVRLSGDDGQPAEHPLGKALAHRQVIVIGRVGAGKGCLLRMTALAYAARWLGDGENWARLARLHQLPDRAEIPIFIDLRHVRDAQRLRSWRALLAEAVGQAADELDDSASVLRALEDHLGGDGDTLLILDGLDELPDRGAVLSIMEVVSHAQRVHPRLRLLLSARWEFGRARDLNLQAQEVEIMGLLSWQRLRLLEAMFEKAGKPDARQRAREVSDTLQRTTRLTEVAGTPMFLELFAPDLLQRGWNPSDDELQRQLIRILFERRPLSRALPDLSGWLRPAGHVAVYMLNHDLQRIDEHTLYGEVQRAFSFIGKSFPIGRHIDADGYCATLIASGLLRERSRRGTGEQFEEDIPHYDFVLDELKDWLTAAAMMNGWSPDGFGLDENPEDIFRALIRPDAGGVQREQRGIVRRALATMREPVARWILDRLVVLADVPAQGQETLTLVFQVMQAGRAPSADYAWQSVRRCCAETQPGKAPVLREEIFAALRDAFGGPERRPTAWGTILGLYARGLSCAQPDIHTRIGQQGWLTDPGLAGPVIDRIRGDHPLDACAAMFEVLEWAFLSPPHLPTAEEGEVIAEIAGLIAGHLGHDDPRADFAAWSLGWLTKAWSLSAPLFEPAALDRGALLGIVGNPRRTFLARRAAAGILAKMSRSGAEHGFNLLADAFGRNALFGLKIPGLPVRAEGLEVVRSLLESAAADRLLLAVMAAEMGDTDPATLDLVAGLLDESSEDNILRRAVTILALAVAHGEGAARLAGLLAASSERIRTYAAIALLVTATKAEIAQLRHSPAAKAWFDDVRQDIDDALA